MTERPETAVAPPSEHRQHAHPPTRSLVAGVVGLILLILGLVHSWTSFIAYDFVQVYIGARCLLTGESPYDYDALTRLAYRYTPFAVPNFSDHVQMYYTPSAPVIALPFSLTPFAISKFVVLLISQFVMIYGLVRLMRRFWPSLSSGGRLLALGAVVQSVTVRDGMYLMQTAPLAIGLLSLMVVAENRARTAVQTLTATLVIGLKITLGLPLLLLLLLRKNLKALLPALVMAAGLNLVGFARYGLVSSIQGYRRCMAEFEDQHGTRPEPADPKATERTDWVYTLRGTGMPLPIARKLALALTLAALSAIVLAARPIDAKWSADEAAVALTGPLICWMLMAQYHHLYDAALLIPPAILYAGAIGAPARRARYGYALLALIYASLRPGFHEIALAMSAISGRPAFVMERTIGGWAIAIMFVLSLRVLVAYRACT